ncbi:hypothetical protein [Streptomyces flavofungini]|uniref:SAF domain-containing protein n=1 Tax=Streptomyces flavofungini TaxID=68200 RepID=A0ABS0X691_9ACTN|nr:hypothetical protein [Streptomyces flavofungini]MBJ3808683.1 hypothetical protein [Streptomyces flavofungini]GHC70859.1 hypothetical protein GCM10010349_47020 [Streptomyces flavofungini]
MKIQERTGAGNNRSAVSAPAGVGERLPTAPRERKPALAALAVLLILVGALGATVLVLRAGDRVEVVKVTERIAPGESVNKDNSTSVMVAADSDVHYVKYSKLSALSKLKAKTTLYPGTVVVGEMFDDKGGLPTGKASVGLSLKEGQYPSTLQQGDTVALYRVAANGSSSSDDDKGTGGGNSSSRTPLVADARVGLVNSNKDSTISTGNLSITVLVDNEDVAAVTSAASLGEVAVAVVPGADK